MNKKILIDLSFIRTAPYTGVAKYAYRIIDFIIESGRTESFALLLDNISERGIKERYPQFETMTIGDDWASKIPVFRTLWMSILFRKVVNRSEFDVVFCPWGNMITCLKNRKYVVSVIHDLQSLIDHRGVSLFFFRWVLNHITRNSDKLVTISEFSKHQFHSFFPTKDIENWGNSVSLPQIDLPENILPYRYILYVGRFSKMKNVLTLIKAYGRISSNCGERKLVVIGKRNEYWNTEIVPVIRALYIEEKVIVLEDLTEQQLTATYRDADLFVFPSLREGFGFPPVEASLMLTPVLSSKEDSLEEVSMGLWYTYESPMDDKELACKIMDILQQPPTHQQLEDIRKEMIEHYSPNIVCKKICDKLLSI